MPKKQTALICALNSKFIHSSLAPWYLFAAYNLFGSKKTSLFVEEGTINEEPDVLYKRITGRKTDIIGFSCYIWNIKTVFLLISRVKAEFPDTKIILGGPEVSFCAPDILKENKDVDFIISGEGENPFTMLIDALADEAPLDNIPGLCFRNNGNIIISESYISCSDPVDPYTNEYISNLNGRIAYLETSRGCPFSCAYCLSGRCGGVRFFDIERVKRNILLLANSGTSTVKFIDRTFNANPRRATEIIDFIIGNSGKKIPSDVCFHFEVAADLLDEATISLLATAPEGLIQLEAGIQSFNGKTLDSVHRHTDIQKLTENLKKIIFRKNIHVHIDLIAGLPYEDIYSFKSSFNKAYSIKPNMLQLGFLKLLHGAEMREKNDIFPCEYNNEPPYEVISTPWLSNSDLKILKKTESVLDRLYNSSRFRRTLDYITEIYGYEPFLLYCDFGEWLENRERKTKSLDDLTEAFFEFLCSKTTIEKTLLRDLLICDRMASVQSPFIPSALRINDATFSDKKRAMHELHSRKSTSSKSNSFGFALIYSFEAAVYTYHTISKKIKNSVSSENKLIFCEYDEKTKRFKEIEKEKIPPYFF